MSDYLIYETISTNIRIKSKAVSEVHYWDHLTSSLSRFLSDT